MVAEDEILALLRMRGPVLPVDVAKAIKSNIIIAGAHLSDMISRGKVKISTIKIGGSPLYYLPGQENKLQDFAANLNDKDYKAYGLLKENKVLRDITQEPLTRVALRGIKDFAVPLNVKQDNNLEIFWKWYLTSDEEATIIIKKELGVEDKKPETQEKLVENKVEEKIEEIPIEIPVEMPKEKHSSKALAKTRPKKKIFSDNFTQEIKSLFKEKNIKIIQEEIIKKDSETNYVIDIPSPFGSLRYFCKAWNKKSCNEKEVSSALIEGQIKKLPIVFLHYSLTKKAEEMRKNDAFKTMLFYLMKK